MIALALRYIDPPINKVRFSFTGTLAYFIGLAIYL